MDLIIIGIFGDWCKVGEIISGIYTRNINEEYSVRFLIVRESNKEEWLNYRKSNNLDIIDGYNSPNAKFYAATTD